MLVMSVISKKSKVPPAINLLLKSLVKVTRKKTDKSNYRDQTWYFQARIK